MTSKTKTISPPLVNAEAEEIACGDFALDHLAIGDQVKLIYPTTLDASRMENRVALWVRITEIGPYLARDKHMGFGHREYLGVVDEVVDIDDTCLHEGQTIRFARCNIVQIA